MTLQPNAWPMGNLQPSGLRWYDHVITVKMQPCSERKRGAASANAHAQHLPPAHHLPPTVSDGNSFKHRGTARVVSHGDGQSPKNKSAGRIVKEIRMKFSRARTEERAFQEAESVVCRNPQVGSLLLLYVTGDLSKQELARFEKHLHTCERCSLDLPSMRMMVRSLKEGCFQETGSTL